MSLRDDLEALQYAGPGSELDKDWWNAYNRLRVALTPEAEVILAELPRLLEMEKGATPAPWSNDSDNGDTFCKHYIAWEYGTLAETFNQDPRSDFNSKENCGLIVALRNALHQASLARNERNLNFLRALRDLPANCDFCNAEVPQDKLEPLSGDQWACHACLDRWDEEDREAPARRIMAMTEEEIRQDCIARGTTLETVAERVKAVIQKAIDRAKKETTQ